MTEVALGRSLGELIALSESDPPTRSQTSDILTYAQWFVDHDFEIVPAEGKTPIGGVYSAKNSVEGIKEGYGIALGKTHVGIDYDLYHGAEISLESFDKTTMWLSGSGKGNGLIYEVPEELAVFGGAYQNGITFRACGSILIGPGSKHPSGGIYKFINQVIPTKAPEWVIKALQEIRDKREKEAEIHIGKAVKPERFFKDAKWTEKLNAQPIIGKRTDQTANLLKYSAERGATNEELAWTISNHRASISKGRIQYHLARLLEQIRVLHDHSGRPCDDAKCPNTPEWMNKELAATDIWSSSPILQYIYNEARFRRVPPKAVLLSVLTHISASVPTEFVLPAIIGDLASLNFFSAFVGESGDGKGSSTRVANRLFDYSATGFSYHVGKGGSGEGLVGIFAYWNPLKKEVVHKTKSAFLNINEIDDLAATGSRNGSTMLSTLREAWFAEALGHDYVKNPTQLPDLSYRLALQVSAQPLRSKWLLDDVDGGLTQRIVFVSTADPECLHPDVVFERPTPVKWIVPNEILELAKNKKAKVIEAVKKAEVMKGLGEVDKEEFSFVEIPVCEEAKRTILLEHWKRKTSPSQAIDSHFLLAREKVALLLAVLHGKMEVDIENWNRSAIVMSWSKRAFDEIKTEILKKNQTDQHARTTVAITRELAIGSAKYNHDVERVSKRIEALYDQGIIKIKGAGNIKMKIAARDREHIDEAVESLVKENKFKYNHEEDVLDRIK